MELVKVLQPDSMILERLDVFFVVVRMLVVCLSVSVRLYLCARCFSGVLDIKDHRPVAAFLVPAAALICLAPADLGAAQKAHAAASLAGGALLICLSLLSVFLTATRRAKEAKIVE